jgi:hypothetical protein
MPGLAPGIFISAVVSSNKAGHQRKVEKLRFVKRPGQFRRIKKGTKED